MYHRLALLLLLTLTLISSRTSQAQVSQKPKGAPPPSASPTIDPATEKKAYDLLESLAEQAPRFRSTTNRIRASAAIADLLWVRDEKRARALFEDAVTQLATCIAENTDFGDREQYQEISRIQEIRLNLVMRIAPHDGEMALNALRQTQLPASLKSSRWNPQAEANLEFQLASFIATKNPELALKIARSSLSRDGLSWPLISFVPQLAQTDAKSAQVLYGEVVAQLASDNVGKNSELANQALYLLTSFQPPQADEGTFRDLLTTTLGAVLNLNRETQMGLSIAQNSYHMMEALTPLVEKYAPTRSAELRNWSRAVERVIDPGSRMYQEINRLTQNGSVDELLALAEKYPPEYQDSVYQNAAGKAMTGGDVARAKEIAGKIKDPVQRRQFLDQIEQQAANNLKSEARLAQARVLVGRARTLGQKIALIVQFSQSLANANQKDDALALLNDGKILVTSAPSSAEQVKAQVYLAQAYAKLNAGSTFAMLQPLIIQLNELVAAAAVLDGLDYRYFKDGEWEPVANSLGMIVGGLDESLIELGKTDFDRALTLAEQIDRPEIRTLIEINLAQAALGRKSNSSTLQRINSRAFVSH